MIRPRLVNGARLSYDRIREENVLLVPEGVVRLNPTATEVLGLCDGHRSLEEIITVLAARYDGHDLPADVRALFEALSEKGLVVDAAA